jgi:hypothetical protein
MPRIPATFADRVVVAGDWEATTTGGRHSIEPLMMMEGGATVADYAARMVAPYASNPSVWVEACDDATVVVGCCHRYGTWQMVLRLAPAAPAPEAAHEAAASPPVAVA